MLLILYVEGYSFRSSCCDMACEGEIGQTQEQLLFLFFLNIQTVREDVEDFGGTKNQGETRMEVD